MLIKDNINFKYKLLKNVYVFWFIHFFFSLLLGVRFVGILEAIIYRSLGHHIMSLFIFHRTE